jgi:Cu/Ag efflux protein CusF
MNKLLISTLGLAALSLAACSEPTEAGADKTDAVAPPPAQVEVSDASSSTDLTGRATGIVQSIDMNRNVVTIDHGPIDGVGMAAMTMGFGLMGEADISSLAEGDGVAFQVKRGRDGSYRIMAICDTATGGEDCLDAMVDQ